ncbi:MAG: helix-turn-helix transcriptional regulator [Clostridiales bacterium]|nr:helix-turn-helix transcriptional regulator [Clostridiales bacterium]
MESISVIIGSRIRSYRKSQNLSQEKLAEMAEIHPTYLGQLERGEKSPTIEIINKIANALQVPLSRLFSNLSLEDTALPSYPQDRILQLLSDLNAKEQNAIYEIIVSALKLKD